MVTSSRKVLLEKGFHDIVPSFKSPLTLATLGFGYCEKYVSLRKLRALRPYEDSLSVEAYTCSRLQASPLCLVLILIFPQYHQAPLEQKYLLSLQEPREKAKSHHRDGCPSYTIPHLLGPVRAQI